MKDFTDITVILDRSGSMSSIREATIEGFDGFVATQKGLGDNACLSLVQFDDKYENVWNRLPLSSVPSIKDIFQPRGCTALLDAIGKTIKETGERLSKMREKDRPDKVIFVIITDGFENASREYGRTKIFDMITHQRDKYNWDFVFLAANQDAIATAAAMGIDSGWAATFNASPSGHAKSFQKMSDKMCTYRSCTSAADLSAIRSQCLYTDEDKEELANS
jgi:hypothetical protein